MAMIGDQLQTDIRGAAEFELDAVLAITGIANVNPNDIDQSLQPTYYLDSLNL
jgi:ribonucleotide monophosphatase NagD (HAD superfamily)